MSESDRLQNQIGEMAAAVFDGSIDLPQFDHFKILLEEQPEARKIYAEIVGLHVGLQDVCGVQPLGESLRIGIQKNRDATSCDATNCDATSRDVDVQNESTPPAILPDLISPDSKDDPLGISDAATRSSGILSFPRGLYRIALPGVVLALFFVMVIGFGWLGNWSAYWNRPLARVVRQSIDAHWNDGSGRQVASPGVEKLGWCELMRGMVKIEFRQGATTLLEGPARFRILNDNALEMASGKLSASVPNSAHGFTVLAPNLKVVDLGTEFGVDASRLDSTSVQVTSGRVVLTTFDSDGTETDRRELFERECFTISRDGTAEKVRFGSVKFPTRLFDASIDLVDLVCGGSGTDLKRGYAVDCLNGKWGQLTKPFTGKIPDHIPVGSGQYQPVPELPFVDGVFVPTNRKGAIRVDSAGHQFFGFGKKTSGQSYDRLMAGADLKFFKTPRYPERLMVEGVDFTNPPHGLLVLRGNKGITFDLKKICKANPGMKITHFRSLAANTENSATLKLFAGPFRADLWVIIDGVAVYTRTGLASTDGTLDLDIPIPEGARFLTLVATEGRKFSTHDWIVFANPTLELIKEE